jgi:hypothetical protein
MRASVGGLAVAGVVLMFGACARTQKPQRAAVVLDSIMQAYPCTGRLEISSGHAARLTKEQNCALANAAYQLVARGKGEAVGITAADTSAIKAATVSWFVFRDTSGQVNDSYWTVDLKLPTKPYSIAVRFDAGTGAATARKTPKAGV